MAFSSASGYTNLPNGNFSPVIYSKKVQLALRKESIVEAITNSDYFGEISSMGDSVKIIKEPEITISDYKRGTAMTSQDLADVDFSLVIDQANAFQFQVDDIEAQHSHVNFIDLATDNAAYKLKDAFDSNILGYLSGYVYASGSWGANSTVSGTKANSGAGSDELLAANKLDASDFGGTGGNSIPVAPNGGTAEITSPLQILNRMARQMDQANVASDDRWFVADPVFYELLQDENSKLISNDFAGGQDAGDVLRNGRVVSGLIRGFKVYKSNNLPFLGTGPATVDADGSTANLGVIVAGHQSAVASAQQISKTESFRSPTTFADIVRGMNLFGRKILRPESIFTAIYNQAA
tara:strand:- start:899 stop:1951 length:1053 start_codon:yes stop_codon:yes gene_type:complete